jgi:Zn-dependent protease with chaperone function
MATDFFDRQDHARRQTTRLVVLFAISVAAIIVTIYLVLAVGLSAAEPVHRGVGSYSGDSSTRHRRSYDPHESAPSRRSGPLVEAEPGRQTAVRPQLTLWQPELFLGVAAGTLIVIALGSFYKIAELSAGGESVALMLGGRAVDPQTTDLAERRLLNVVEEMALASGIPVPPVFVLDNEPSINAFAAGHQPGDAVVAVSAGALQYLTREELQGVMGHEFSHILNGDMRLNLRLIGVVNGILVLAILGYYLMRFSGAAPRRSEKDNSAAAMFMLGLVVTILGYLGVFFGNLIKSAISRQREFLADASAVQFTRYPGGIAGALKKIGGLSETSQIRDGHAQEISHMFFADAFAGAFFRLFATHPPLVDRIRALEPDFDGQFHEVAPVSPSEGLGKVGRRAAASAAFAGGAVAGIASAPQRTLGAGDAMQRIGTPQAEDLESAHRLIGDMPPLLISAAREPFAAQAVIFALLLSQDDEGVRGRQIAMLQAQVETPLVRQTQQLEAAVQSLAATARLPLVDMTIPAIKRSSPQQYARFRQLVEALVAADEKISLFEYSLRTVLFSYLDVHYGLRRPPTSSCRNVAALSQPLAVVLSTLARVGQEDQEQAARAFQAGAQSLPKKIEMLPLSECSLMQFDAALGKLADSSPAVKREILNSVAACVTADGQVTLEEGELLRAVAAVLACPMPPL